MATASDQAAKGIRATPRPVPAQIAEMESKLELYQRPLLRLVKAYPNIFGSDAGTELVIDFSRFNERGGLIKYLWGQIWPYISTERVIGAMLSNPAFFFMIIGLYAGLIYYVGFEDGEFIKPKGLLLPAKIAIGGLHAWLHIVLLLTINTVLQPIYDHFTSPGQAWPALVFGVSLYSALLILIGGILGGMVFGLYWVLTSIIGKMHMDSFGALGIPGYKNFLRLKVEPDKITVYAIGLDKVPDRKGWRALHAKDDTRGHNPIIKPIDDLRPHLIEPPYEIRVTAKTPPPASIALKARPVSPPVQATKRPEPAEAVAKGNLPDGLPAWKNIWSPS